MKKKHKKNIKKTGVILSVALMSLSFCVIFIMKNSKYKKDSEKKNPFEGKRVVFIYDEEDKENADGVKGHLLAVGDSEVHRTLYEKYFKRAIDIALSFGGLVVLSPFFLTISVAIKIDDPGPVFFTQNRLGYNKEYFRLHKFRSMKMSTPHDVPTHMLENSDQYITKVGHFLRAYSLDELPQIWDILIGNMSIIGPRPALWNQDVLIAERDKYGVNEITPGLTGWAQINGRDELEIAEKAKLDGDYVQQIKKSGINAFFFDCRCFIETIMCVINSDGIVEGGKIINCKDNTAHKKTAQSNK